jgi:DNA-binding transcriptional MerR regulator
VTEELAAGEVARRLGVAVTTLRSWHRRYQLGPTGHAAGRHRRYTAADVARLETMRQLTARGIPAADAARRALGDQGTGSGIGRDGGGHMIPVPRGQAAARGLGRAAVRLDAPTMLTIISAALVAGGVVDTWDTLLCPVLVGIGERHAATGRLVEVEHVLSRCITEALAAVPRPDVTAPARILLASGPEEQHSLPLEALAAALAERSVPCRLLGARVPARALTDAVRRTGPAAVVVWSHHRDTADGELLRALVGGPARPAVVAAAGPGWADVPVPAGVDRPTTLTEALSLSIQG